MGFSPGQVKLKTIVDHGFQSRSGKTKDNSRSWVSVQVTGQTKDNSRSWVSVQVTGQTKDNSNLYLKLP